MSSIHRLRVAVGLSLAILGASCVGQQKRPDERPHAEAPTPWATVDTPEFAAILPGSSAPAAQVRKSQSFGSAVKKVSVWYAAAGKGEYTVIATDWDPEELARQNAADIFTDRIGRNLLQRGGALDHDGPFTLAGPGATTFTGREVSGSMQDGSRFVARLVFVGPRLYELYASAPGDAFSPVQAQQFVASLKVKAVQKVPNPCGEPDPETPCDQCPNATRPTCEQKQADLLAKAFPPSGAHQLGKAKVMELGRPQDLTVPMKRGTCYGASYWFQPGAQLDERVGIRLDAESAHLSDAQPVSPQNRNNRFWVLEPYCPQSGGTLRLFFSDGSFDKSGNHELSVKKAGTGQVKVTLWTTRVSERDLRDAAEGDAQQVCTECMRQRLTCQRIGPSSTDFKTCAAEFSYCLKGAGVPASSCKP